MLRVMMEIGELMQEEQDLQIQDQEEELQAEYQIIVQEQVQENIFIQKLLHQCILLKHLNCGHLLII